MAFCVNGFNGNHERVFENAVDWYGGLLLEDEEYGSPLLDHIEYGKPVRTIGELKAALAELCDKKYADQPKAMLFREYGENSSLGYEPLDLSPAGGFATLVLKAVEGMPQLMPVDEIRASIAGMPDDMKLLGQCGGEKLEIRDMTLDVLRFPGSPDTLFVVVFDMDEYSGNAAVPALKDAYAAKIPRYSADFVAECRRMAKASGDPNFMDRPLVAVLDSVPDPRFQGSGMSDDVMLSPGTLCVIDQGRRVKDHAEIDLMSFDREKEAMALLNSPADSGVGAACAKMKFGGSLPLFFMFRGKPFEISAMYADAGRPLVLELAPWGTVNESKRRVRGPKNEIELWARWCEDPILSWRV